MIDDNLLTVPRYVAERTKDFWEIKAGDETLKIWTDPAQEEDRVYINVFRDTPEGLRRVKAVTGLMFVPVTIGDVIRLHIKNHNLFLDMNDFALERVTFESVEYCPFLLWDIAACELFVVPGIKEKVEVQPLTPEQRVAFEIERELYEQYHSDSDSEN